MSQIALLLALLLAIVALAVLARRIGVPLPVLLVVGGLLIGLVGRALHVESPISIPADRVLQTVLPPLLASAAFAVPLGAFRANLRAITLLAVGLVLVTLALVGWTTHWLVPAVPLSAAFVLGAIVSPPDAVAATAVAGRIGLPNRIATILEGEGLVNDATALVAYEVAVVAATTGQFAWSQAGIEFLRSSVVGVATGALVGWLTADVLRRLDDEVLETTITLLTPYAAYLAADQLHASGVLATVTFGFLMRRIDVDAHSASTRLAMRRVWDTLVFLIDGLVFILIGMALGAVAAEVRSSRLLLLAASVSGIVIAIRLVWVFGVAWLFELVARWRGKHAHIAPRELFVVGWAGMRGVVSLAAALALPLTAAGGAPFPARATIILVTFGVLFATLVLQGLTLTPLAKRLGVASPRLADREEEAVRRLAHRVSLERLDAMAARGELPRTATDRARRALRDHMGIGPSAGTAADDARALLAALDCQRETVLHARHVDDLGGDRSRSLEEELDVQSVHLHDVVARARAGDVRHVE
jgi:CPA1 family monovalent cation:H+ antiporter